MTDSRQASAQLWPSSRYAWYVVAVLSFANVVSFVDRFVISLMVDPIKADLGVSDTQMGLLMGMAFAVFYAVMALPLGVLADRSNRKRIILVGAALWTVATAACGLTKTYFQLFLARISVGVGEATLGPAGLSIISDSFPRERVAKPISVFAAAGYAGFGVALLVGGYVVQIIQDAGAIALPLVGVLKPWQLTYLCVAAPGIIVVLLMLTIREPVRRGVVAEQGPTLGEAADAIAADRGQRMKAYGAILLGFPILAILGYGTATWVPTFLYRLHGLQPADVALYYGLIFLVFGTAGPFAGGWFTDWLAQRGYKDANLRAAIFASIALLPFAVAFPLVGNTTAVLFLLIPVTFLGSVPFGVSVSAIIVITPNQQRAVMTAVYLFLGNFVGLGLGPAVVPILTDYVFGDEMALHYSLSLLGVVILPVGIALLWLGMKPFRASVEAADEREARAIKGDA